MIAIIGAVDLSGEHLTIMPRCNNCLEGGGTYVVPTEWSYLLNYSVNCNSIFNEILLQMIVSIFSVAKCNLLTG